MAKERGRRIDQMVSNVKRYIGRIPSSVFRPLGIQPPYRMFSLMATSQQPMYLFYCVSPQRAGAV